MGLYTPGEMGVPRLGLFSQMQDRMRGNGPKLCQGRSRLDIGGVPAGPMELWWGTSKTEPMSLRSCHLRSRAESPPCSIRTLFPSQVMI